MLPTEKANGDTSGLSIIPATGEYIYGIETAPETLHSGKFQHLYLISDDVIKEKDWFINTGTRTLFQATENMVNNQWFPKKHGGYWGKVIASTDPEISSYGMANGKLYGEQYKGTQFEDNRLPKIPESFIKDFAKANGIDDVIVEYGKFTTSGADHVDYKNWYDALKLTNYNEVIISIVEENILTGEDIIAKMGWHYYSTESSARRVADWCAKNMNLKTKK